MSDNQKIKITSYAINWSDETLKPSIVVARGTVDTSTSISLVGYDVWNWGQLFQENFLHLLENFAASTPPVNATIGQLWFDTPNRQLKCYNGSAWVASSTAFIGNIQPTGARNPGDLWYDIDGGTYGSLKVLNSDHWDPILTRAWANQFFLNKTGDVMTGNLHVVDSAKIDALTVTLRRDPITPSDAATKRYVDSKFIDINTSMVSSVPSNSAMDPDYWNSGVFAWTASNSPDAPHANAIGIIAADKTNFSNQGAMFQIASSWNALGTVPNTKPNSVNIRIKDPETSTWSNWRTLVYKDEVTDIIANVATPIPSVSTSSLVVGGTEIISSTRQLQNITSVDATTINTFNSLGFGGGVIVKESSNSAILTNGVGAAGTSNNVARADHVHPSDPTKASLNSPALTGIPTAPTAVAGTDTTQLATCQFVNAAIASKMSAAAITSFNIMVWS